MALCAAFGSDIIWLFILYRPLRTFTYFAIPFASAGLFLVLMLQGEAERGSNVQSVIVGSAFIIIAFIVFLIGLVDDLIAINRRLLEESLYYLKRLALLNHETNKWDEAEGQYAREMERALAKTLHDEQGEQP